MRETPIPVRLLVPHASEDEFFGEFEPCWRQGSIFLATSRPSPPGAWLVFEFVLASGKKVLRGEGRVIDAAWSDSPRPGMTLLLGELDSPRVSTWTKRITEQKEAIPDHRRRWQAVLERPNREISPRISPPIVGIEWGIDVLRASWCTEQSPQPLALENENSNLPAWIAWDNLEELCMGTRALKLAKEEPAKAMGALRMLLGQSSRSPLVREIEKHFFYDIDENENGDLVIKMPEKAQSLLQISSQLLAEIQKKASLIWGSPVKKAVIAVPSCFYFRQREAIQQACQLAGWELEKMVSEPVAAAMAYEFGKGLARKRVLVFHWDGRIIDICVLEITGNDFEMIASGGETVGVLESASTGFAERSRHLCKKIFDQYKLSTSAIDEILLLGEQSRIQGISEWLEHFLGKPVQVMESKGLIASGAALLGKGLREQDQDDADFFCLHCSELLSASIAILVFENKEDRFEKMLSIPSRLPCEKTREFCADEHGELSFWVFQGEGDCWEEMECLGEIRLAELDVGAQVEILFSVSRDGILTIFTHARGTYQKLNWNRASFWKNRWSEQSFFNAEPVPTSPELNCEKTAAEEKGIFSGFKRLLKNPRNAASKI